MGLSQAPSTSAAASAAAAATAVVGNVDNDNGDDGNGGEQNTNMQSGNDGGDQIANIESGNDGGDQIANQISGDGGGQIINNNNDNGSGQDTNNNNSKLDLLSVDLLSLTYADGGASDNSSSSPSSAGSTEASATDTEATNSEAPSVASTLTVLMTLTASTPSGTPSTPSGVPSTSSGIPSTASGIPSTPSEISLSTTTRTSLLSMATTNTVIAGHRHLPNGAIAGIAIGCLAGLILIFALVWLVLRQRNLQKAKGGKESNAVKRWDSAEPADQISPRYECPADTEKRELDLETVLVELDAEIGRRELDVGTERRELDGQNAQRLTGFLEELEASSPTLELHESCIRERAIVKKSPERSLIDVQWIRGAYILQVKGTNQIVGVVPSRDRRITKEGTKDAANTIWVQQESRKVRRSSCVG